MSTQTNLAEPGGVGVSKLIEFLNTTRRQAELSINNLNEKIQELSKENEYIRNEYEKLLNDRNNYKSQCEILQNQSNTKARLQERDDWKSLVESVQKDRSRLQDECNSLAEQLELSHKKISELESQIRAPSSPLRIPPPPSPGSGSLDSPTSIGTVRRLREEIDELKSKLDQERKTSAEEISILNEDISRLSDELAYYKRHASPSVPHYLTPTSLQYLDNVQRKQSLKQHHSVANPPQAVLSENLNHNHTIMKKQSSSWFSAIGFLSLFASSASGRTQLTTNDIINIGSSVIRV